jgi:TolB-like protein/DNA-binding winged helix-turn-helix (wHTH) protein
MAAVLPDSANGHDAAAPQARWRVGDWAIDPHADTLTRDGPDGHQAMRLEPKVIEVLVHLARHPGEVVTREELLAAVWPGVVVGDEAVTQAIIKLRKALGDDARQPRFIETIPKRGYRLIAAVDPIVAAPALPVRRAWPVWAAALAAAAMTGALVLSGDRPRSAPPGSPPIVAVLPLVNQSGDPARDYFSDGLTEDLINALSLHSGLRVIAHQTVAGYKGRPPDTPALRKALGVRYVARGSVREADGRLRVALELSDADTGLVLWSDRYEGDGQARFAFQDRVVRSVVGAMAVKVGKREEEQAASRPPESLQAYDLVLRARALVVRSERAANRQARALAAQALSLAPDYAEAHLVLASAEAQRSLDFGWSEDPAKVAENAEQHALRALALGDVGAQARAHGQLGIIYSAQGRHDEALAEVDRAVALNPSDARALETRSFVLVWLGRLEEGVAASEMAERFDPVGRSAGGVFSRALALYMLGRFGESVAVADAGIARFPQTSFLHAMRAAALAQRGELAAAQAAAAETLRLEPFFHAKDFGDRFKDPRLTARLQDGLRKAGL